MDLFTTSCRLLAGTSLQPGVRDSGALLSSVLTSRFMGLGSGVQARRSAAKSGLDLELLYVDASCYINGCRSYHVLESSLLVSVSLHLEAQTER